MSLTPLAVKDRRGRGVICRITVAKRLLPHFVIYPESHLLNMQNHSREAAVAQSQSRSDCYPILLNMQIYSREATVMPRRCGVTSSINISN